MVNNLFGTEYFSVRVVGLLSRVQCLVHVNDLPFGDGKSWPEAPTLGRGIHSPQRAICFDGTAQARGRVMECLAPSLSSACRMLQPVVAFIQIQLPYPIGQAGIYHQ